MADEQAPKTDERPEWLQDKFSTVEQQAEAYADAQKKITEQATQMAELKKQFSDPDGHPKMEPKDDPEGGSEESDGKPSGEPEDGEEAPKVDPVSIQKYEQEFASNGELSEESYKGIQEKFGLDKAEVDDFIKFRTEGNPIYESVGGFEGWQKISSWATDNVPTEMIEAHNALLKAGNKAAIKLSMQSIQAEYQRVLGKTPSLTKGRREEHTGTQPYKSQAEITRAMQDPKYKQDPAYRAEVQKRIAVTP